MTPDESKLLKSIVRESWIRGMLDCPCPKPPYPDSVGDLSSPMTEGDRGVAVPVLGDANYRRIQLAEALVYGPIAPELRREFDRLQAAYYAGLVAGHAPEPPCPEPAADEETVHDTVNHPSHYNAIPGIECIDVVEHFDFVIGNVIKYAWRSGLKGGTSKLEDLRKCLWYAQRAVEREEKSGQ